MYRRFTIFLTLLLFVPGGMPEAKVWVIAPNGSGDCPHISAGVDSAAFGDTLMLAPGVYTGLNNREISFGGKNLVVTSQKGAGSTVIDCEFASRAFIITKFEGPEAVVSNVTIMNAQFGTGGAMYIENASPTIRNCRFLGNRGTWGAAIYVKDASPIIENNVFDSNDATQYGGAMYFDSNGIATVIGNKITNNSASIGGGGIYCSLHSPEIIGNVISRNTTISGGGIYLVVSNPLIEGNTIAENTAAGGSGIFFAASSGIVRENIIAFNFNGAGMTCQSGGNPEIDCNLLFGNGGGDAVCGTDNGNNIFVDPEFCGATGASNFFLQSDSPCLAANNGCLVDLGALGVNCTTVDALPKTWGSIKHLYGTQ